MAILAWNDGDGDAAFLIVSNEIQNKMLGVLRALGLRNSVYWASWMIPFMIVAALNSFLASVCAKFVPIHVYEQTYFAGIFASFFFLQLALVSCSFFLAAVCGGAKKGTVWWILVMLIAVWIPPMVIGAQSYIPSAGQMKYLSSTPVRQVPPCMIPTLAIIRMKPVISRS